jgi:hypothetical protein
MDLGEFDPQTAQRLDQVIEASEGFDFIAVIYQEKTASGAFFEEYDPLSKVRRILNDVGGADMTLCMPLPYLLALHA